MKTKDRRPNKLSAKNGQKRSKDRHPQTSAMNESPCKAENAFDFESLVGREGQAASHLITDVLLTLQ